MEPKLFPLRKLKIRPLREPAKAWSGATSASELFIMVIL